MRRARRGETCVCGRPARVVHQLSDREVPWCGLSIVDIAREINVEEAAVQMTIAGQGCGS